MSAQTVALVLIAVAMAGGAFVWWRRRRVEITFGTATLQADGRWHLVETQTVPFRPNDPNFDFGFVLHSPSGRKFKVRVDHVLPARPEHYQGGGKTSYLDEDGRFKIEGSEVEIEGNYLPRFHSSPGDPLGWYEAHVFIDGGRRSTFRYQVCVDHAT